APAILTVETGITLRVTSIYNNFSRSYGSLINRGAIIAEAGAHAFSIEVDALTNEGVISAINGKSLTLNTLSNTVGATVSVTGGGTLTLNNVTNAGTISAIDSTINVGGSVRLEDIGTFNRINSTVYLTGTLDNTGSTLFVDTAFNGGFVLASGGVIKGGIVDAVADDYVMSAIGGTLDNVTLETDLTLSSSISYPLYVTNGLVLNRTLTLGVSAQLRLTGTQTISGSGQVIFGNSANLYIYGTSSAVAVLTVDTGITLRVTGNYGSVSRYCGSLINRGAIIAEAGSYAFSIEVDALTNEGVISAINGKSLSINTLTNAADATVSVTGGSTLTLSGVVNAGTISATDATVNFGGSVRLEDIGTFNRVNSTVYLTGTLDNTDAILLADTAFNGGFILASGGVIIGGVLDATADDYVISAIGGTLNNVTLEADLTLSSGTLYVTNGLVLNATLTLANSWLQCNSTQTISGSGEVIFGHSGHLYIWGSSSATAVLTVDTGMTLRTTGNYGSIYNHNGALVNQGAMLFNAGSGTFSVSVTSLTNEGVITAGNGKNLSLNTLTNTAGATIAVTGTSTLTLTGTLDISDDSQLLIEPSGKLNLAGNMTGNVTDAALCDPQGTVTVSGGTLASPRLIEVMSQDQGAEASGFAQNFAYGALSLASNAWVKLVNESDNAAGEDPDALYVMTLTVPNGATLDLNGLTVYARTITMQGTGKVINGTVTQVVSGFEYTDLVVSSVTAPETATVGERISLEWVVTNSGDQATNTSAWYDKVVLSTDAQVGNSDDILLGTFRHDGALEPEESYTRSAAVTLPAGLDGNFQIFVVTDTTNTVYEFLREHNNTSAASPITISSSDLVVTTVSVPEAAQFGSMVDVSWTVANTGSASTAGSWVDRVYLSSDDTLNGATLLYSRTQTDALSAGADYTATASVQLPLNASMTAGSYFLIVRTNATGTQSEISTTNNTGISSAISVSLPALPDLQVQNLAVTPESGIQAGSEVTVSWDDANTGDADISTVWHDHIQVVNTTTGTTLVSQTLQHDPVTAGALAAGESLSRSFTFTLPEGATGAGDIRVVVTADSNGQIFEYNLSGTAETNNTAEIRFASTPVTAANHAPVANDDVASGIAGSAITGNVLDNDTDADDDVLTAELISGAASGTVELLPDGSFTYSPDTGFVGEDSFTYRAFDGEAYSGDATVMITVTAVNHAPVANDDTVSGNKDSVITGNVLANDTDADDDTLTAELISNASFGAVTLHSDGSFTYTPNSGFDGEDYFIYRAFDGKSYSMAATVWITVTAVNHAPVANDDVASGIAGSAITGNVLDNDTDADDDVLTAELISGAASGTVELLPDGSFTYTPDTGFVGEDSFTYRAFDGEAYSADATVMITVTAVNHAPVAVNDQAVGDAGSVITGNVLTNDTDADDDTLTAELISGAASGAVELLPN
ncbi:Ig-like domain-containing protein, partial [Desulfosarcina sp. OttesenSCG-928-G10]|nr:Ig-like domain-containing protein [Desulfosarcina sp. OttesenSCG-928-G10]